MTHDLDDKIIAAIRAGSCRFGTIGSRVGAVDRVLDRALQRLRRAGKIACKGTLWSIIEDRAAPPHAVLDAVRAFLSLWSDLSSQEMYGEMLHEGMGDNWIALSEAIDELRTATRESPPAADPTAFFLRWLCEIRRSMFREGWEDGRTDAEILNDVTNVLANFDCDPGTDDPKQIAKFNELLAMPRTYHPEETP